MDAGTVLEVECLEERVLTERKPEGEGSDTLLGMNILLAQLTAARTAPSPSQAPMRGGSKGQGTTPLAPGPSSCTQPLGQSMAFRLWCRGDTAWCWHVASPSLAQPHMLYSGADIAPQIKQPALAPFTCHLARCGHGEVAGLGPSVELCQCPGMCRCPCGQIHGYGKVSAQG